MTEEPSTRREALDRETPNRWITSPAARRWIYGVLIAVIALLVTLGVVTPEIADGVTAIVVAVLGIGGLGLAEANTPKGR